MRLLLQAFYIKKAPSPHKVKESRIPLTKQSQADIRDPLSLVPTIFSTINRTFIFHSAA